MDTKQRYEAPWLVRYGSLMALTGKLKGLAPSDDLSAITCDVVDADGCTDAPG